jgi:hypothetical protein
MAAIAAERSLPVAKAFAIRESSGAHQRARAVAAGDVVEAAGSSIDGELLTDPCLWRGDARARQGRHEQHRIAGQDRLATDRYGQMRLADPRWPQRDTASAMAMKPRRDLADLLFVDRGLGGKVEAVEISDKWEARQPDAHLDAPLFLAPDLALAEQRQRLTNGQLASAGFIDQAVELIADRRQLEPVSIPIRWSCFHHQRPPTARSYSSRGRNSSLAPTVSEAGTVVSGAFDREPTTPSKWTGS